MDRSVRWVASVVLAVFMGCGAAPRAAVEDAGSSTQDGPDASVPDAGPAFEPVTAESLVGRVAASSCGALFRCCDAASRQRYFAPYRANTRLLGLAARFPPADEAACTALLGEALEIVPFGPWVQAVDAGLVGFDAEAASTCLQRLEQAACGPALAEALEDGRCFSFSPPSGGPVQRSMFVRTSGAGTACRALNDGVGGGLYGTCDPASAFCCYERPGVTGCALGNDAGVGTCQAVSAGGSACSLIPLQLCATGAECSPGTGRCEVPPTTALALGNACVGVDFSVLGDCAEGFCDVFGTRNCEPRKPLGAACLAPDECQDGACTAGACAVNLYCAAP